MIGHMASFWGVLLQEWVGGFLLISFVFKENLNKFVGIENWVWSVSFINDWSLVKWKKKIGVLKGCL